MIAYLDETCSKMHEHACVFVRGSCDGRKNKRTKSKCTYRENKFS
jgi:hypothetical protein